MATKKNEYYSGIGRRKGSVASVRVMLKGSGTFVVNEQPLEDYVNYARLKEKIMEPFIALKQQPTSFDVSAKVRGGGFQGQAEAIRLGLAKAMLAVDPEFRQMLRQAGLLTTDARVKERKKYGLKKARKAPQYTKR